MIIVSSAIIVAYFQIEIVKEIIIVFPIHTIDNKLEP